MNKIIIVITALTISGCATIFSDSSDKISIHSNVPDAKIIVNGNNVGVGSAVYTLPRDKTAIITARKKGCDDMSVPTEQSINKVTFFNLFFAIGYLVDASSGAIHKADPTDYTVSPNCSDL